MASEEQGVLAGEGDVAVYPLYLIVVPGVIAGRRDGFDAIPFVEKVVRGPVHLRLRRIFVGPGLHFQQGLFQILEYWRGVLLTPLQVVSDSPVLLADFMLPLIPVYVIAQFQDPVRIRIPFQSRKSRLQCWRQASLLTFPPDVASTFL